MATSSIPAGRRELTRSHITFYRAVMEGVDTRRAWDLYVSAEGDFTEILAHATLTWVRQALISEAAAAGKPELVGLFRRDPRRIAAGSKPTLEEFAERLEDAGDWSEADLLEMWKEEFGGPDRAEERRTRLASRLREALQLLERAARKQPQPDDPVARWLAPNLATKLAAAGLETLGAARASLEARTNPRWPEVPGVGEVWAQRLLEWLKEAGIEAPPPSPALPAAAPTQPLMLPFERVVEPALVSPSSLPYPAQTGAAAQRGPYPGNNALGARDDRHAIELWLAAKASNPNTHRAYRKSVERLFLWCQHERLTTFPELTVADCIHYQAFLKQVGRLDEDGNLDVVAWERAGWRLPADVWVGKKQPRDSPAWRPFEGALRPESIAYDLLVAKSLFEYLLRAHIVQTNPWALVGKPISQAERTTLAREQFTVRSLTLPQWRELVGELSSDGPELERRLLLVLWLGFGCGLRASEMCSMSLGHVAVRDDGWRIKVLGKGAKTRFVPLPSPARQAMLKYLESVGVPFEMLAQASRERESTELGREPVLRGRRGRRSKEGSSPLPVDRLGYTGLYDSLKAHFAARAEAIRAHDAEAAHKFERASTHWLRHTFAKQALKGGVRLPGVQKLLGHASLNTTQVYVTEEDDELQRQVEALAKKAS